MFIKNYQTAFWSDYINYTSTPAMDDDPVDPQSCQHLVYSFLKSSHSSGCSGI